MHDWIFEARAELLMLTLPDQPWSSDQGATSWFSPEPADDFETWLPGPESKGDLGDFGLLFNEPAAELDDVVTTARRIEGFPTAVQVGFDYGSGSGSGAGEPPGGETGGGWEAPPSPDDDHCRSAEDLRSAGDPPQPGEQEAIDRLQREAIPETTRLLNRIPGGTFFTMPDGASVSIEELRNLWAFSDFEVLDNFNPGNGGPGQSDYNNGNPIFRIDVNNGLIGYMENPNGYTYYPLHELSHVTGAGRAYHAAGHGYVMNESYANALAVAIAAAAGTPMNPHYLATLPTAVQNGVQTTMGTGAFGTINPNSPCGG